MMSFSLSGGVEVYGFIAPTEITDEYPVIDPLYGIDGFRNVNTLSDLNSIPNLRRRAGMVVGVSGGTQYYKLNPSPWNGTITDWSTFNSGSGGGTFTGGTVTGDTIFTQGVTATTFSASTYLGLPLDVYTTGFTFNPSTYDISIERNDGVTLTQNLSILSTDVTITGGTYDPLNGSITFVNNTGGTFTVSGFITGFTDIQVTGYTYQDNTFTISDSSGNTFSATIDVMTGLTVNGLLSATTLNVNGVNITGDTYTTGGTYSNGTIIFDYNTGGGYQVTGLYTGQTSYVNSLTTGVGLSGDSTTGNITIINTDPDQVVTISGGTGILTGGTYPNFTIENTLPDQVVSISGGTNVDVTGTYPNFNIALTGLSDNNIYTTGFTYSANTFYITDTSGNTFSATIDVMTGLTINGDLTVTGTTSLQGFSATTISASTISAPGSTTQVIYNNGGVLSADTGFVYSGSRVGIGTTTPSAKLDVRAQGGLSTDIAFRVRNSGDTGNLFAVRGDSNIVIGDETLVNRDIIYLSNRFIRFQTNGLNVTNWFASPPPVDLASSHKFGFNNNSLFELKGDSSLHIGLPGINQFSMALRVNSTQNILEGFRNAFNTNVKELRIRTGEPFTTGGIPYNSGNIVLQTGSGFNGGLNGNIIFQISSGLTEVSRITSTGLGIGTSTPTEKLDVSGKTKTINLQVTSGPTSGYVLTSDASGNATWQSGLNVGTTQITNGTSGRVLFQSGTTLQQDSGLFWDNTNKFLQIYRTIGGSIRLTCDFSSVQKYSFYQNISSTQVEIASISNLYGTGMVLSSFNNLISFNPGNTERVRITDTSMGVFTSNPQARLHVANADTTLTTGLFSGTGQNILTIIGSGSTQPIFTVQGSSGELFSVSDSLIGSLFSVNDISGLPILEVFSDNTTLMGSYLAPSLNTTSRVVATTGTTNVYSIPTSAYTGAFFDYTVSDGTNLRAGNIMSIWSGSSVNMTETQTTDFGNTSGLTFNMVVSSGNAILRTSGVTGNWTVKTIVRSI